MTQFNALFRIGKDRQLTARIVRIYSEGWDNNLGAWTEEVTEVFDELCRFYGDDPGACRIVGDARWLWMRFSRNMVATVKAEQFNGSKQVTMVRVHRKNTPGMKRKKGG